MKTAASVVLAGFLIGLCFHLSLGLGLLPSVIINNNTNYKHNNDKKQQFFPRLADVFIISRSDETTTTTTDNNNTDNSNNYNYRNMISRDTQIFNYKVIANPCR